jgi:hypothetical protein
MYTVLNEEHIDQLNNQNFEKLTPVIAQYVDSNSRVLLRGVFAMLISSKQSNIHQGYIANKPRQRKDMNHYHRRETKELSSSYLPMLRIPNLPLPPPPSQTKLAHPRTNNQKHKPRRRPRKRKKLAPLIRLNPHILPMLIDNPHRLDNHRRNQCARYPHGKKRQQCEQEIHTCG